MDEVDLEMRDWLVECKLLIIQRLMIAGYNVTSDDFDLVWKGGPPTARPKSKTIVIPVAQVREDNETKPGGR